MNEREQRTEKMRKDWKQFQTELAQKLRFLKWSIWGMLASSAALLITLYGFAANVKPKEPEIGSQIEQLDKTQAALKGLIEFVQKQKDKIQNAEDVLKKAQEEHAKIKPVVDADKKVVDAVMAVYADRAAVNVWWERGLGFASGIVSSMIATLFGLMFARTWLAKRLQPYLLPDEVPNRQGE